jgi:hypothetical protein
LAPPELRVAAGAIMDLIDLVSLDLDKIEL